METLTPKADLTTTAAPYIEEALERGEIFIEQPYELYSEANHDTWRRLYADLQPKWQRFANGKFLEGLDRIALDPGRIPRLEDINSFLQPLSSFKAPSEPSETSPRTSPSFEWGRIHYREVSV